MLGHQVKDGHSELHTFSILSSASTYMTEMCDFPDDRWKDQTPLSRDMRVTVKSTDSGPASVGNTEMGEDRQNQVTGIENIFRY